MEEAPSKTSHGKVSVPPSKEEAGMYNRFSCFAVLSKLVQSLSEIIAYVTIKVPGKAGKLIFHVKVDPGAEINCIPLHKFQCHFPHLCNNCLPKEGVL